jgi:hypothetical protein
MNKCFSNKFFSQTFSPPLSENYATDAIMIEGNGKES